MKKNIFKLSALLMLLFLGACVDTEYNTPTLTDPDMIPPETATMTIAELKALHTNGDNDTSEIPEGTVILGQVISSDQAGNIYKEIYIQDETGGILIRVDSSPLYPIYKIGQQLQINCDGLVLGSYGSNVQLGVPSIYNGSPAAGRIPTPLLGEFFVPGKELELVPEVTTVNEIRSNLDDYTGRWVEIQNISVASSDRGKTYADAINEVTQNRYFNDGSTTNDVILRTSGYSDFAGDLLPEGTGTMHAIVSRFRDDVQLYINDPTTDMVKFEDETPGGGGGTEPPLVNSVSESFNGTKYDDVAIEGWTNVVIEGGSAWFYNEFDTNSYANISVYNSGEKRVTWLISPLLNVDAAESKNISFTTRQEFSTGASLKVYVSSDYDGLKEPEDDSYTWTEISATISDDGSDGYGTWTSSGDIDLSSYGNVVVGFKYEGEETVNDGGYSIDDFVFNAGGETGPGEVIDPETYFASTDGMTGYALKTELHNIISKNTIVLAYSSGSEMDVWDAYKTTDDKYGANGIIWDMYSDIPNPESPQIPDGDQPNEYEYTMVTDQCGNYSGEGSCYNREHSFPKSYFDDAYPMYSDIFHLVPTDGKVNGQRGNHPYGEVGTASWTSINGSKLGSAEDGLGYSGTVFEPIDEYKGDFARNYFYMATRYEDIIGSWQTNSDNADAILDGSSDKVYEDWYLALMIKWHTEDPVSTKEQERNDAVSIVQGNRNPFIDHPEWVGSIWGD